jgi:hypothetical protein
MLGLNLSIFKRNLLGGGTGFESEYLAVLSQAVASGYTLPSSTNQIQQNTLMKALKDCGALAKLDHFYVFSNDGSREFAHLNWIDPTKHEITEHVNSGTIEWDEQLGFRAGGNSTRGWWLNTNFKIASDAVYFKNGDSSRITYLTSVGASNNPWGSTSNSQEARAFTNATGGSSVYRVHNSSTGGNLSPNLLDSAVTGLHVMHQNGTDAKIFTAGIESDHTHNTTAIADLDFVLFRSGTSWFNFASRMSIFGQGADMRDINTPLSTAINNYMDAIL